MKRKLVAIIGTVLIASLIAVFLLSPTGHNLMFPGTVDFSFSVGSIHSTITITDNGKTILSEYHAGVLTQMGMNITLAKLTGNSTFYNMTTYPMNLTYVSIGDQGSLSSASIVLPGEWNRTTANQHDPVYNSFNLTAVIYPGAGPYTADCLGVNYEAGIGNNALWGYDTFTEVTGITNTFVITLEVKITIS